MREIDLHGLTVKEALKAFVDFYNHSIRTSSSEPIRIIHGYGSSGEGGKLRLKIRELLDGARESLGWKSGEDAEANLGVTIVFPRKILHIREDELAVSIIDFCSTPRTESKISAEFRSHEPRSIKQTLRSLVRQGRLKEIQKSGHTNYVRS